MKKLSKLINNISTVLFIIALLAVAVGFIGWMVTITVFLFTVNFFLGLLVSSVLAAGILFGLSFLFPEE